MNVIHCFWIANLMSIICCDKKKKKGNRNGVKILAGVGWDHWKVIFILMEPKEVAQSLRKPQVTDMPNIYHTPAISRVRERRVCSMNISLGFGYNSICLNICASLDDDAPRLLSQFTQKQSNFWENNTLRTMNSSYSFNCFSEHSDEKTSAHSQNLQIVASSVSPLCQFSLPFFQSYKDFITVSVYFSLSSLVCSSCTQFFSLYIYSLFSRM